MLFLIGCAPSPGTEPPPAAQDETAVVPPTGDSMDDPIPVDDPTGLVPMRDTFDPVGDEDWFSIELDEGQFLRVQTVTVDGDPHDPDFQCDGTNDTNPADPVVIVYDPDGNEV